MNMHEKIKIKKKVASIRLTYQKIPSYLRWIFFPIKILYRLIEKFRINIWIIAGQDSLKRQLSIIYAGSEKHKNYLANLAFDEIYNEINIGKWLWNIFKITKRERSACSLMVLEINKTFKSLFDNKKCFFIPCWIDGIVDIPTDMSLLIKKENLKSDVRKITKNNLQFELTNEEYQFDNFYNNMYLPYVSKAHGNKAILMTYDSMKNNLESSDLLLTKKDKEYIGGVIILYEKNVPRIWSIGVKDGNTNYLKDGVLSSLYYFAIKYLKQKGYSKVYLGLSRAFFMDGVLQYKKKWGLKIVDSTKKGFLIKPLSSSIVTKEFFIKNPFIYADQDRLTGAIFLNNIQSPSKKNLKKLHKACKLDGISKFVLYIFGDNKSQIDDIVPEELSDRMTICSGDSLF